MSRPTLEQLIEQFNLQPLPREGGHFRQTWSADSQINSAQLPERYHKGQQYPEHRLLGTCIYYLITDHPESYSALHRLITDEIWHFYLGDPVELVQLYPDGRHAVITLGNDILNGQQVQFVAPRGVWMGARLTGSPTESATESRLSPAFSPTRYALMGTTMTPGYADSDYEHGDRSTLLAQYPAAAHLIHALARME